MEINHKPNGISAREYVYLVLKEQILSFQLTPGTSISEKEISIQFNVSRTPVRESFMSLAQDGLLDIYPQRGTFVSFIDLDLVEEARFMREHLERAVIKIACENFPTEKLLALEMNVSMQKVCIEEQNYKKMFELDEDFHKIIFSACNKSKTWAAIQQMNIQFNRSRMLRLTADLNWDYIYIQHSNILKAIKDHDAKKGEELMKDHLRMVFIDKELLKKTYPSYFTERLKS